MVMWVRCPCPEFEELGGALLALDETLLLAFAFALDFGFDSELPSCCAFTAPRMVRTARSACDSKSKLSIKMQSYPGSSIKEHNDMITWQRRALKVPSENTLDQVISVR